MNKTAKATIMSMAVIAAPVLAWAAFQWNGAAVTVWNGASISAWNGATVSAPTCADSSCTGFLVCQNFEGTGTDNGETWTELLYSCTGCTFNPDYSTNPIRGSQSLLVNDGTVGAVYYTSHTASTGTYYHWRIKILDAPGVNFSDTFTTINEAQTQIVAFTLNTNGTMNIAWLGTGYSTGTTALSLNTTYHMWAYIGNGTGSNAEAWLKISETTEEPDNYEIHVTNGTWTTSRWAVYASTMHDSNYEFLIDQVLVKTTAIGDVCN